MPFFEETRAGVLVSRLTADVQTLTTFTRQVLVEVVGSVLLFGVTVVILVSLSPLLSLVMLISVPLLAWSSLRYGKRSRPAFLALRDRVADTMTSLQEGLTGVRVVQSFAQEQEQYAAYRAQSRAQVSAWRRISLVNIGLLPDDRVRTGARARGGARRRRVPRAARAGHRRDRRRVRAVPHLALRPGRTPRRLVQRVPVRPRSAREDLVAAGRAGDGPRRHRFAAGRRRAARGRDHVRVRRQRARGLRSVTRRRAGRAPRPRRRHGCGQVDAREAPRPRVRPAAGVGLARRSRPARGDPRRVALPHRLRSAGGTSVLRVDRRQRAARASGSERLRRARGATGDRRTVAARGTPRRARDRRPLARRPPLGGRAPARLDRARRARRPRR